VPAGLAATLSLVQALGDLRVQAPLWVLTSGAVAATPGEAPARPVQAQAWGLGRVVALEHPDFGGGLIDVPPVLDDAVLDDAVLDGTVLDGKAGPGDRLVPDERAVLDERMGDLLRSVLAGCGEDQVAIRPSGLLARRLVRADHPRPDRARPCQSRPADPDRARAWTPRGTALVTGGTGAIGGHVARWLAGRGAPRVILASRSGPVAGGVPQLAAQLAAAGTAVEVTACDSADRGALAGLLAGIAAAPGCPSLTSVFHAAGAGESAAVYDVSAADLAVVTGAKAAGAAYLDELTAGTELDAFVLFSSIAATWGSALQPGYAAANAFLDAVAEHRRGRGLQATSIAWGPWSGGGMTDAGSAAQLRRRGLRPMDPGEAVAALGQVLDAGEATVTVADVDWARFVPPFTLRRASPLIESLPEVRQALTGNSSPGGEQSEHGEAGALARRLAELPRAEQDQLLTELVQAQAATVLGHESALAVQADHAFSDLGADSLTAVELRDRLMAATGVRLPATLLFDYPTPVALASYLRLTITSDGQAAPRPVLAELDRLESALDAMTPGDSEAARITARLESVMAKWKGIAAGVSREFVTAKLESSSDTEVFDFIVNELGIN
jgi:NAD(P)-dependent dehydrogenase (short-subunit alcohol dehydrogenase family)/acyl carrier protein